jgi:hypothetical protein
MPEKNDPPILKGELILDDPGENEGFTPNILINCKCKLAIVFDEKGQEVHRPYE